MGPTSTPPGYGGEGVFEFTVYLPVNTNTAYISIPLLEPLEIVPPDPQRDYKNYYKNTGGTNWILFDEGSDDAYYSAPGDGVTCPLPVDPSLGITQWGSRENELVEGHQCVLLVIKDAQTTDSVNDSDGQLNGIIVDPGAPGTADPSPIVVVLLTFGSY